MADSQDDSVFEEIMLQVGNSGKFQKYYNITFNFFFVFFGTTAFFCIFVVVTVPDHWCHVPHDKHNFTLDLWKNLTIPWEANASRFSQCTRYGNNSGDIQECAHGWEYDKTYYGTTISTQENWVCSKKMHVTNLLVLGKIGEILGTAIMQLGDVFGRKPIFYASILSLIVGRCGLIFSGGNFWLFVVCSIIGSLPSTGVYVTPLVISMEVSSVDDRTSIPLLQCIAWCLAISLGPMIYWVVKDWMTFTLISTLPIIPFLFVWPLMIESPRWLASKGDLKKCADQLRKITKINGTELPDKMLIALGKTQPENTKTTSVLTLFATCNMAKRTTFMIIGWICYMVIYIILFLNVTNLKGNPFINYFWQGLAELPGYFLGQYLSDTIGRKWGKSMSFFLMAGVSLILVYVLLTSENVIAISVCGILMRFFSSIVFYTMNLQTLEIYPTCLRQTGSSLGFLVASIFGIFTPYVIYMGTAINPSVPYIASALLALLGGVTGFFLPETYNQKLPETIEEAEHFGEDQKLFSFPKTRNKEHKSVPTNEI